jgi:1-hydroxycarotenoid 3,4-desaturase
MLARQAVVIGAGIGGLVAALLMAVRGLAVTLVETAPTPGGKMREVEVGGTKIDAGPTVFTMRWVFDEIFEEAGVSLSDCLILRPAETLARHSWNRIDRLDLCTDAGRNVDAVAQFANKAEAAGYLRFCDRARSIYETLRGPFICDSRPSVFDLVQRVGLGRLDQLVRVSPFSTLWNSLGEYFQDDRLRQLFGRYATYCGSSPFRAPATLMLIAHVERTGVWLIEGGMHRLAQSLADLCSKNGAVFRYGAQARQILVSGGCASGVELADGETLPADVVVLNGDVSALGEGLFGPEVSRFASVTPRHARSLSAVTWAIRAGVRDCPLVRHNVFFSDGYRAEFDDVFTHQRLPREPTVYVCAQDRDGCNMPTSGEPERLLCLVNAPANGDAGEPNAEELRRCEDSMFRRLADCGLELELKADAIARTTPTDFHRLYPASGGALYGRASHGWTASFARPGSRTRLPGLYLAGGSVHPGPGAPMAALSGRLAAWSAIADLASTVRSVPKAMLGGMSTR